jgi:two-component system, OmpR family, response regulator ResD
MARQRMNVPLGIREGFHRNFTQNMYNQAIYMDPRERKMDIKILVADDDPVFRELVCDILRKQGYTPVEAGDGEQAIDVFFGATDIDLVLLDVMMPGYDGWEVLKEIREYSEVPVIMLTALDDERHEVLGLKKGADDYIAKPFSYEVFTARFNTFLRRIKKERLATVTLGDLRIEQATHKVFTADADAGLNRKEYQLLMYLIRNKGKVMTREQILAGVWGYDFDGDIRTIDTHIKTLRAKLSDAGRHISTVRGIGYLFEEEAP